MSASVDPLGNRTSSTFDLAGQQTSRQDARGNRITYSYDLAGRQIALRNELDLATTSHAGARRTRPVQRAAAAASCELRRCGCNDLRLRATKYHLWRYLGYSLSSVP